MIKRGEEKRRDIGRTVVRASETGKAELAIGEIYIRP